MRAVFFPLLLPACTCSFDHRHRKLPKRENLFGLEARHARIGIEKDQRTPRTIFDCTPDSDGFFGSTGNSTIALTYNYEVETDPTKNGDLTGDILPAVESKINDLLLRIVFFPQKCGVADTRKLSLGRQRRLELVGLSSKPLDDVMEGVLCQLNKTNDVNDCSVVSGELRLFISGGVTDEKDRSLQTIKTAMNGGEFNALRAAIVRVTFIDLIIDSFGTRNADPQSPDTADNDDGGGLSVGSYVGMALGGLLGLLSMLLCFFLRRKAKGEEEDDDGEDESQSLNSDAMDFSAIS